MSLFASTQGLEEEDSILGLASAFRNEPRAQKVNLGIGAYSTAEGCSLVLSSVQKAEKILLEQKLDKDYLPIEGEASYLSENLPLVFGAQSDFVKSRRTAALQTIGATSALRLGGEYLSLGGPRAIYVSDPTWPNHRGIFGRAGLGVKTYPYFDKDKGILDFTGMCQAIEQMPLGSAILLHACCHNPTGIDPSPEQWRQLSSLIKARGLFPFFDLAYQGFALGLEEDALPVRIFSEQGHLLFVANSFSKNFGLYGERVGALTAVCEDQRVANKVQKQLKTLVRANYSTPPLHGARIVRTILQSEPLRREWEQELVMMRTRIQQMRKVFVDRLESQSDRTLSFLRQQHGLFSFGLLHPEHVSRLIMDYAIYLPGNGRINVAGLTARNVDYVVDAVLSVIKG